MASKKKTGKKPAAKKTAKKKIAAKKSATKKPVKKKSPLNKSKPVSKKSIPKKSAIKKVQPKSTALVAGLSVGQIAPKISLRDESGLVRTLSEHKGKIVVVYFYPKDDTPGCTKESCDFRDSFSRLKARGVEVYGISKDSSESHLKFKNKYSLNFSLLADVDGEVCDSYGVWKEKSMYGRSYMGIERTTFVLQVDGDGSATVKFIYPKVSVPGHVDAILKDLGV